ncbi:MAG TPA: HD domain-containing protein [Bacteroidales bacterium]|nr:HD domain-containing protein [Bacteroidales bacterium]
MSNSQLLLKAASFAAARHQNQKRKGASAKPYINHPIKVAEILASNGEADNTNLLIAALLHDVLEDTVKTPDEMIEVKSVIHDYFGANVLSIVEEVTDDKSLPKQMRKQMQIEHAPHLSVNAKKLKLADKNNNLTDILHDPPTDWPMERKYEYFVWAEKVLNGLSGINPTMEGMAKELVIKGKHCY